MTRVITIAKRELFSYFTSPVAYVAMTLFLLVCGFLFRNDFISGRPAGMRTIFEWMVWLLVFIIPVLCMGLLAQELSSGTIETMMTAPISETDLVGGKFLGSFGFFVVLMLPTILYVVMLRMFSHPDLGPIVSGYLGILMIGALFIAIGLLCSSLTRSQVVAAVTSSAVLFLITIVPWWAGSQALLSDFWRGVTEQMVFTRYTDFSRGVIDTGHIIFFIVSTFVCLFVTVKVMESRRWK